VITRFDRTARRTASALREAAVALFRRNSGTPEPETAPPVTESSGAVRRKAGPTPSRKVAEAARRQRVTPTLNKKEARLEASRQARARRLRVMSIRESVPEKALMRDYVDARFSLGELLLPSLALILLSSFLSAVFPRVAGISVAIMYLFIFFVLLDGFIMWRGFKKVLAQRLPAVTKKGLLMYGMNRCIQIRRFRIPPPRIKRGEAF